MEQLQHFLYQPAPRPTPMLAYQTAVNQAAFSEAGGHQYGTFSADHRHIWNIGAYLIYDAATHTVLAYKFDDLAHLVWLLRIVNQPLKISFTPAVVQGHPQVFAPQGEAPEFVLAS